MDPEKRRRRREIVKRYQGSLKGRLAHRANHNKIKMETLAAYSDGPIVCRTCLHDDIRALHLDHINNNGAADRKTRVKHKQRGGVHFYKACVMQGSLLGTRFSVPTVTPSRNMNGAFLKLLPRMLSCYAIGQPERWPPAGLCPALSVVRRAALEAAVERAMDLPVWVDRPARPGAQETVIPEAERERRAKRRAQFRPDGFDADRTDVTVLVLGAVVLLIFLLYAIVRYRG